MNALLEIKNSEFASADEREGCSTFDSAFIKHKLGFSDRVATCSFKLPRVVKLREYSIEEYVNEELE